MNFSFLPSTNFEFLHDVANKTMACYTFPFRPTILESENLKIAMKKIDEEENEDFCTEQYFNFEELIKNFPFLGKFFLKRLFAKRMYERSSFATTCAHTFSLPGDFFGLLNHISESVNLKLGLA